MTKDVASAFGSLNIIKHGFFTSNSHRYLPSYHRMSRKASIASPYSSPKQRELRQDGPFASQEYHSVATGS